MVSTARSGRHRAAGCSEIEASGPIRAGSATTDSCYHVTVRDEDGGPWKVNRGRRHTGHGARGTLHWVIYDQRCGVPVCSMSMCVCGDDLAMKKREVSENYVRWGRHVPVPAAAVTSMVSLTLPQIRAAISGCDETNVSTIAEKSRTDCRTE